jgi:hypothetical protein
MRRHDLEDDGPAQARRAIAAGNADDALRAIDRILAEEKPIHDLYGDMCASLLTFIASRLGEEAVEEAWRHVADDVWKPVLLAFKERDDVEGLASAFAAFLKSHRYEFEVHEDDEKWTFVATYCTSGERMLVEGKVERNPGSPDGHGRFGATERAYAWSLERKDFPYYDVHSALWMKLLPAEWGWDVMDVEYGVKPNGHVAVTRYVLFKRRR